jgi:hypothetical protein
VARVVHEKYIGSVTGGEALAAVFRITQVSHTQLYCPAHLTTKVGSAAVQEHLLENNDITPIGSDSYRLFLNFTIQRDITLQHRNIGCHGLVADAFERGEPRPVTTGNDLNSTHSMIDFLEWYPNSHCIEGPQKIN